MYCPGPVSGARRLHAGAAPDVTSVMVTKLMVLRAGAKAASFQSLDPILDLYIHQAVVPG
jgi:hypothetical protein